MLPELEDPLLGLVIGGKFRIEEVLGSGGMGNVYRAEQLSLGKPVAVKVLHRELMTDDVVVRRFEREARSASRLDHPNLVQIIDFGRDDGSGLLFIAMELLSGRDLGRVIVDERPMPLARAAAILSQVLSALEEAHRNGVIHRDLKPANVMLVPRRGGDGDVVKVCDFGIAKAGGDLTSSPSEGAQLTVRGFVWGTPEYMSPEQARGEDVDARADIYAAGVVLHHMLAGAVPFSASSPVGILSKHLAEPPPPLSLLRADVPAALEALVARALAKSPIDRPQTARAFREQLEAICPPVTPPRPVTAPRPTTLVPIAPATRTARRAGRAWWRAALALGLIAGLASGATALHRAHRLPPPPQPPVLAALSPPPEPLLSPTPALIPAPDPPAPRPPLPRPRARPRTHARPPAPPTPALSPALAVTPPPVPAPAPVPPAPPSPRPRDLLAEGERLLGQGDVSEACARGETARQLSGSNPAVHRFLGKCYLRAGDETRARQSYRRYLDLAPDAADAAFIRSIVK